jgi:NAD(P)-dependent dehydrogenase (short-subunit alcohol dehydrogenase family)
MSDFSNQVVVITGTTGNLGTAVARKFMVSGAKMGFLERSPDKMKKIFPETVNASDQYLVQQVDVTNPDSMEEAANVLLRKFGRIDILINTVGGYRAGAPLHQTPLDTLDFMLNLNARSVFVSCQAFIPSMIENNYGKIVNVSARPGLIGVRNAAAYSASKSAVIRLTESISSELKHKGINVNCVLPGTIDTPQNRQATPDTDFNRWVSPESIADVILFLVSDVSSAIHGAAIPVYGRS